jgi:hypothetical protein
VTMKNPHVSRMSKIAMRRWEPIAGRGRNFGPVRETGESPECKYYFKTIV